MVKRRNENMSEKPKKRVQDEIYEIIISALHRRILQVTEIYDLGFDDVMSHIESVQHGC